jgi:carboxylate-amine ligase
LIGAAHFLSDNPAPGPVRLVFQPAEERGGGARTAITDGALSGVSAIFAGHVSPDYETGKMMIRDGSVTAQSDRFCIKVRGKGGHGARPHEAVDAVVISGFLIAALQTLVSREINPLHASVVTIGKIQAGSAANVIAEEAELLGSIRSFREEVRRHIHNGMKRMVGAAAELHNAEIDIRIEEGYPPVINETVSTDIARQAAFDVVGQDLVVECWLSERVFLIGLPASLTSGSMNYPVEFNPSPKPTVGVEWELQLLDPITLDLVDGIMPLMEFFPNAEFVKPEYIQSCVELNSCIAENSDQAVDHIRGSLTKLLQRCAELNMDACGSGTHPFCRRLALITPLPRYRRIEKDVGHLAHTQITFSTHVHIGMKSGDEAMQVISHLAPAIPAFIALSANSPFWRGHDTGHAVYRHRILAAAPNYTLPPPLPTWNEFTDFMSAAQNAGMVHGIKDIHWDIRPHPDFGTIEIRTMDAASDLITLHALVSFARSMALCFRDAPVGDVNRIMPLDLPDWIARENRYRAAHLGFAADYIVDERGTLRPLTELIADLIEFCRPTASSVGEAHGLDLAADLLAGVPGYERQLRAYEQNQTPRSVVRMLTDALVDSAPAIANSA